MSKHYDIIILSGGFDPLHIGHVRMIQEASTMADKVIVGINSDEWLSRKKGYIFMPFDERLAVVVELESVYGARKFNDGDDTANDLIKKVYEQHRTHNPECKIAFGNGGDRTDKNTPESQLCLSLGIDMVWGVGGDFKMQSSSSLVKKFVENKWRKSIGKTTT